MNLNSNLNEGEGSFLEVASEIRVKGYFRVDHTIFSDDRLRQLSGDCFRVFLWMSSRAWRFPASKGFLRASISMIHLSTGVSEATVSRALMELKTAGLIKVIKVDRKLGNQWWVETVFQYPQDDRCRIGMSQNEGTKRSKGENCSVKKRERFPQNEGHIKSINKTKNSEEESDVKLCWEAFHKTYPTKEMRELELQRMVGSRFAGSFNPPVKVMENLVVQDWFLKNEQNI